jgi:hypothetical protein
MHVQDTVGLDHGIQSERCACLPLTPPAVAAMNDHRGARQAKS